MRLSDTNVLQLMERRKADSANLEHLVKGIVTGVEELDTRNKQLTDQNAELDAALQQSREREARLERSLRQQAEVIAAALAGLTRTLSEAEDAVGQIHEPRGGDNLRRFSDVSRRILDLQKEVIGQLEQAREEIARRDEAVELRGLGALREAREAIAELVSEFNRDHTSADETEPLASYV